MDKGFTSDAIPALSLCESPIEGKFVQAFFDVMNDSGMVASYEQCNSAKILVEFKSLDDNPDDFLANAYIKLAIQSSFFGRRFDFLVSLSACGSNPCSAFVELDGKKFHESEDRRMVDGEKTALCFEHSAALVRFPGNFLYANSRRCVNAVIRYLRSDCERLEEAEHWAWSEGIRHAKSQQQGAA